MSINELLKSNGNVQIVVNAAELKEVFNEWCNEREAEREAAMADEKLSSKEVMDIFDISAATLWRWGQTGYLIPIKIGGRSFFWKKDVDRLRQLRNKE